MMEYKVKQETKLVNLADHINSGTKITNNGSTGAEEGDEWTREAAAFSCQEGEARSSSRLSESGGDTGGQLMSLSLSDSDLDRPACSWDAIS